jgi:hypothetical protein
MGDRFHYLLSKFGRDRICAFKRTLRACDLFSPGDGLEATQGIGFASSGICRFGFGQTLTSSARLDQLCH